MKSQSGFPKPQSVSRKFQSSPLRSQSHFAESRLESSKSQSTRPASDLHFAKSQSIRPGFHCSARKSQFPRSAAVPGFAQDGQDWQDSQGFRHTAVCGLSRPHAARLRPMPARRFPLAREARSCWTPPMPPPIRIHTPQICGSIQMLGVARAFFSR